MPGNGAKRLETEAEGSESRVSFRLHFIVSKKSKEQTIQQSASHSFVTEYMYYDHALKDGNESVT